MKSTSWNIGKEIYERETCVFHELQNTFKMVKLEEVLTCNNEISVITKSTQNFVQNQDIIFKTTMDEVTFEQWHQPLDNKKHLVPPSSPEFLHSKPEFLHSEKSSYPTYDSTKADESLDLGMVLDQAFKRSTPFKVLVFFVSQDKELTLRAWNRT